MSGGFVPSLNHDGTLKYDSKPFNPESDPSQNQGEIEEVEQSGSGDHHHSPIRLNSKQEARLRAYLDEKLMEISRGWKKRYTPNSSLETLPSFLSAHRTLLSIMSSIPPVSASSTSLLTSYLLRVTSDLSEGICGYSISESHSIRLSQALIQLDILDKLWSCVLNGRMLNFKLAESTSYKAEEKRNGHRIPYLDGGHSRVEDDDDYDSTDVGFGYRSGSLDPFANASRSMSATPAPSSNGKQVQPESFSIPGSRLTSTLGQTDKVRLRNLLVGSKEMLFIWMRGILTLPKPPELLGSSAQEEAEELFGWRKDLPENVLDDEERGEIAQEKENATTSLAREEDEELEEEMEEVVIEGSQSQPQDAPQARVNDEGSDFGNSRWDEAETDEQREEHEHYKKLFDRKLDPDASDSEEEDHKSGLQIKSSSTSAQPISFINSRSQNKLKFSDASTSIETSKPTPDSTGPNQKRRKFSDQDQPLPKLNANSKTENSSILSKLNQKSIEKQKDADESSAELELPYEGAPSRNPQKPKGKGKNREEEPKVDEKSQPEHQDEVQDSEEEIDGNESEATFSGSMASSNNALLWDLTFARLFSRTLKGLAEK